MLNNFQPIEASQTDRALHRFLVERAMAIVNVWLGESERVKLQLDTWLELVSLQETHPLEAAP